MANKIQYGISNLYYAKKLADGRYDTPVKMPGAESLTITNSGGDSNIIWADNINYWSKSSSAGKSGELQMAKYPVSFRKDILGQTVDETTGALLEGPGDISAEFALLFQVEGDQGGLRVCWYSCTATNPTFTAATATDSITEASETSTITASPIDLKGKKVTQASMESGDAGYAKFFESVPLIAAA